MNFRRTSLALVLGTFACSPGPLNVDDNETDTDGESGSEIEGDADTDTGTDESWSECEGECPEGYTCVDEQCVPPDPWPCQCTDDQVCIDDLCVDLDLLPDCAALDVDVTEAFSFAGADADITLGEFDQDPGLDLVGISVAKAITWKDGVSVESPLPFSGGGVLHAAAVRANHDDALDIAMTISSLDILYQLAGDGAGGFANEKQRNFAGKSPRDVAPIRTAVGVEGLIVTVRLNPGNEHQLFLDAATSVGPEQVLTGYIDRSVGDFDGDEVDELIIHEAFRTEIWRREGDAYVPAVELSTTIELLGTDAHCNDFAIGDLDGDADLDVVCFAPDYADSNDFGVLVPFFNGGDLVFTRGEPIVVAAHGIYGFADFNGDQTPELLMTDSLLRLGPNRSFDCAAAHDWALGNGTAIGDLDGDGADELVLLDPQTTTALIHDLSW